MSFDDSLPHNYYVDTNPQRIDLIWTLSELQNTYFGKDRSHDQLAEQIRHSLPFCLFRRDYLNDGFPSHRDTQVGFARVVTDHVQFGWLADFLISSKLRGRGLGHQLMHVIINHHALKSVTLNLGTRDAVDFYRRFGFVECGQMMLRR